MTIRLKSTAGLPCAYKPCMRLARTPEMAFIVRGRYRLEPGAPLTLVRSDEVSDELIEKTRKDSAEAADDLDAMCITLGQGSITGPQYEESDEGQVGEVYYPNDFADYKLKTDVLLRGACYPPSKHDTECDVTFSVGDWKKTLKVVGHRVWVDHTAGGKHTDPQAIGSIAVDYAHAYGGPGFDNNPVGKGHIEKLTEDEEDFYQPPRSKRSAVMPSKQLPNIVYANGKTTIGGIAAGFGPVSPNWKLRRDKLGKKYDQEWLDTRAPYFAEDMDPTYHNAAPPDQQLKGFLRGDEEVAFENLHPKKRRFSVKLPAQRIRVFIRDADAKCREVVMHLDTLFADLDDDCIYLTWRGVTPVKEEDLTDIEFGLIVSEPLGDAPKAVEPYIAELEAFAADPVGLADAFPEGFMEFAANAEKLQDASDEELDALLENEEGNSPPAALVKNIFGPLAPKQVDKVDESWAKLVEAEGVDENEAKAKLAKNSKDALRGGGGGGGTVGMRLPVRDGEKVVFPVGNVIRQQEKVLLDAKDQLPDDADPKAAEKIDAALERLRTNPQVLAVDPHYKPYSPDDPPPDEPGPGADLLGRDLSDMDLSGMDLSGADIQCAILSRTNLAGANLQGAKLGGARLNRVDLSGANLTDVDLTSASFDRVTAKETNFNGTRLDMFRASKSDLTGATFVGSINLLGTFTTSTLDGTDFGDSEMLLTSFDECQLSATRFGGAELGHVRFDKCECPGIVLEGANLLGASFNACQLPKAAASGVKGQGAVWLRCGLQNAVFHRADLKTSHFYWVDATGADFTRANVPGARFDRAILREATFEGANLLEADLRKTVLTKTNFRAASLFKALVTEAAGADVNLDDAKLDGVNWQRSKVVTTRGVSK